MEKDDFEPCLVQKNARYASAYQAVATFYPDLNFFLLELDMFKQTRYSNILLIPAFLARGLASSIAMNSGYDCMK